MDEFTQKIVVGVLSSVLSIIGSALVAYFVYLYYQAPALVVAQDTLRQSERDRAAADAKAATAERRAAEAQDRFNKYLQAWNAARNQFVGQMAGDIACTLADQRPVEGKQPTPPRECAQRLINRRNEARQRTLQIASEVGADMNEVYQNLNSDIDALQALLARIPPASTQEIVALVAKINNGWASKVTQINRLAEQAMRRTGCPVVIASNP